MHRPRHVRRRRRARHVRHSARTRLGARRRQPVRFEDVRRLSRRLRAAGRRLRRAHDQLQPVQWSEQLRRRRCVRPVRQRLQGEDVRRFPRCLRSASRRLRRSNRQLQPLHRPEHVRGGRYPRQMWRPGDVLHAEDVRSDMRGGGHCGRAVLRRIRRRLRRSHHELRRLRSALHLRRGRDAEPVRRLEPGWRECRVQRALRPDPILRRRVGDDHHGPRLRADGSNARLRQTRPHPARPRLHPQRPDLAGDVRHQGRMRVRHGLRPCHRDHVLRDSTDRSR